MPVRDLADIQRIETEPLAKRGLPRTTYEVFTASAERWPDRKALSFFCTADTYQRASTWTYAELLAEITRSANALYALGVSADHPVAYVLPNLPETHFTIWGGEAAGVVLAVNPLLEPDLIMDILRAAKVRVLVEWSDHRKSWSTVGVSDNVIEASWNAMVDAIRLELMRLTEHDDSIEKAVEDYCWGV